MSVTNHAWLFLFHCVQQASNGWHALSQTWRGALVLSLQRSYYESSIHMHACCASN